MPLLMYLLTWGSSGDFPIRRDLWPGADIRILSRIFDSGSGSLGEEQEEDMRKWIAMLLGVVVIVQLCGCSGIEPEKRRYPLAMEWIGQRRISGLYAMPDLPSSTGQQKQEEGGIRRCSLLRIHLFVNPTAIR